MYKLLAIRKINNWEVWRIDISSFDLGIISDIWSKIAPNLPFEDAVDVVGDFGTFHGMTNDGVSITFHGPEAGIGPLAD